jgi:Family of unknown function (DUF6084)
MKRGRDMPDLNFAITGVEAEERSLTPMLSWKLQISGANPAEPIQGVLLNAQIQFECPQRSYTAAGFRFPVFLRRPARD